MGDPFQILFAQFRSVPNHGSGEGGFLIYTDMKKFLKNLLGNHWSDFQILLQESGFDIRGRPDCPIQAVAITGQAAFTICGQIKFLVNYR